MQRSSINADPVDAGWGGVTLLRITLGQLRVWDEEAARNGVIQPKDDEEAWEGTEIDVRRTVL